MMRPRGLPIVVPPNLKEIPIPTHLPKFFGSPYEDLTAHVERFEELLVSSLETNPGHYLIWFPNTLMDSAYSWYRSHAPRTFITWDQLQIAFLRQFLPKTGQQQALATLTKQVSYLTKNQTTNSPAYHESGQHTSGIWCTIQGCPNPMGYNSQFCPVLLQQHKMASPTQYSQQQPPQKPQLYQPPH